MLQKQFSKTQPVEVEDIPGRPRCIVRFGITPSVEQEADAGAKDSIDGGSGYTYYETEVPFGKWNRKGIINAIVRSEYTVDEELSVLRDRDDDEDGYERYRTVLLFARQAAAHLIPSSDDTDVRHRVGMKDVVYDILKYVRLLVMALPDEQAALYPALFPSYRECIGSKVTVGDRVCDDGRLFKALRTHTASDKHYPSQSSKMFVELTSEVHE